MIFSVLLSATALAGVIAVARGGAGAKPAWKISGQLEEACSCDAACPCWMDSKPTRMNCSGGQVIFISKGSYGNVPLDGLAIGFIGQNPEGTTMMGSIGNWNFVNIYIDEKANPEQRKALEAIAQATSPPAAPPDRTKVSYVPITRTMQGSEHVVKIGSLGVFSGNLVEGGMGGHTKIVNPPGADPLHKEYEQGKTTKLAYTDSGQKWDWSNTNYMFANFSVDSAEMEKFDAAMTQKMKSAEKKSEANN
jgi:hypothetical protein